MWKHLLVQPNHSSGYQANSFPQQLFWLSLDASTKKEQKEPSSFGNKEWYDSTFPCVYIQHPNASLVLVYAHPYSSDVGSQVPMLQEWSRHFGVTVLSWEYPGYGMLFDRQQRWSLERMDAHMERVLYFLIQEAQWTPSQVVLFGTSLGVGATVRAAWLLYTRFGQSLGGLILQSPYAFWTRDESADPWNVERMVADLAKPERTTVTTAKKEKMCPMLFMHGQQDRLLPPEHSQRIAAGAPSSIHLLFEDATHTHFDASRVTAYLHSFLYHYVSLVAPERSPRVMQASEYPFPLWHPKPSSVYDHKPSASSSSSAYNDHTSLQLSRIFPTSRSFVPDGFVNHTYKPSSASSSKWSLELFLVQLMCLCSCLSALLFSWNDRRRKS